jgi:hypothetical protein
MNQNTQSGLTHTAVHHSGDSGDGLMKGGGLRHSGSGLLKGGGLKRSTYTAFTQSQVDSVSVHVSNSKTVKIPDEKDDDTLNDFEYFEYDTLNGFLINVADSVDPSDSNFTVTPTDSDSEHFNGAGFGTPTPKKLPFDESTLGTPKREHRKNKGKRKKR